MINDHFILVLISMSFPAVVRRAALVCVFCICRGLISYLFFVFVVLVWLGTHVVFVLFVFIYL